MVSTARDLKQYILCLRDSADGHVRHSGKQGDTDLRFTLHGWQGLGSRCPLHIVEWPRTDICIPSSSNRSLDSGKNQNVSRNDAASQHPSRPWHPLLLQLSVQTRIPLLDVELFQFIPNHRRPQYHREPSLLDLAVWLLSATSSDNITSPSP